MKLSMKQHGIVIVLVAAILSGGLGFFGGMQYQKSRRPNFMSGQFQNRQNGTNAGQNRTGRNGMQPISGEISAADATSITVKMPNGSSKIVLVPESTVINTLTKGTKADLKVGEQVLVLGSDSSGTTTAQSISIGMSGFRSGMGPNNNQPNPTQ